MATLVAAVDQGTTSTRTLLVSSRGEVVARAQAEHRQSFPAPGLVEHDPDEILARVAETFHAACRQAGVRPAEVAAIGIANQRETTVLWDRATGRPVHPAVVWQDVRTRDLCSAFAGGNPDRLRELTGLPLATYFAGPKLAWLLANVPGARAAAGRGELAFGTVESFLLHRLTGAHLTDVTNASRTMLLGLHSLDWEPAALELMNIPRSVLPRVVPNTSAPGAPFGVTRRDGPLGAEIPIVALLGDQQAALVGQACLSPGELKNTYGTGCFLLLNTGTTAAAGGPVASTHGLLTTLAYHFHGHAPHYALEGSIAVAGALVQWLRDNLGIIATSADIEPLAASVPDSGGVTIVPAFSGLFAPWWDASARGTIVGLTRHTTRAHLARAALEATAFQTRDVLDAMTRDRATCTAGASHHALRPTHLKVDGGMTRNRLLMQLQADLAGLPVIPAAQSETTALGVAYAALLAIGAIASPEAIRGLHRPDATYTPQIAPADRDARHATWLRAVEKSRGWVQ